MISASHIPIVIVSYRNPTDVVECLTALQRATTHPAFDVYVCENGGPIAFDAIVFALTNASGLCEYDEPDPIRAPMPYFLRVRYLRLRGRASRVIAAEAAENFGYAGAINAWLRVLLTEPIWPGVWLLNPDTRPQADALDNLVAWSAERRIGMVGSRVVAMGSPQIVATRGLRWRQLRASVEAVDRGAPSSAQFDSDEVEARIDAPSGTSIYVTRQCLDHIGLMEEQYFLYFEDLDWGYRAKRSCGVGYSHKSVVEHRKGTTIGSGTSRANASPFSVYLEFRNRLNFVRQHHPAWKLWTMVVLFLRALEFGISGAPTNVQAALLGLRAGIAGETGRPDRVFDFSSKMPAFRKVPLLGCGIAPPSDRAPEHRARAVEGLTKRVVKIAVSVLFHLATGVMRQLRLSIGIPAPHRLVILCYHSIPWNLRARFARQMDALAAVAPVVPADYHETSTRGGHSVAITFDDAFVSVLNNAIPELSARGMPAMIFVPLAGLGSPPSWEIERDYAADAIECVASAYMLTKQISDLVQLGAHSLTHPHLTRLPLVEARSEIVGCRGRMQDLFKTDVLAFAFPYGEHDAIAVELCREAGYEWAFTTVPHNIDPTAPGFVRGRTRVDPTDWPLEFYLKIHGAYAWMALASDLKRRLKMKLAGSQTVRSR